MKLKIGERLVLLSVLPSQGSYVSLKIVRDLQDDLGFSEGEVKEFEIEKKKDGAVVWNTEKDSEKEIEIGDKAKSIIKDELKKLDEKKKLEPMHLSVYEKFVG